MCVCVHRFYLWCVSPYTILSVYSCLSTHDNYLMLNVKIFPQIPPDITNHINMSQYKVSITLSGMLYSLFNWHDIVIYIPSHAINGVSNLVPL